MLGRCGGGLLVSERKMMHWLPYFVIPLHSDNSEDNFTE
jgi:hypothetical protein